MQTMRDNARYLAKALDDLGKFEILNPAEHAPCVIVKLKDSSKYNVADLSATLAQRCWIVPAFSLPPDPHHVDVLRMVMKETFSRDMADILITDFKFAIAKLERVHSKPHEPRPADVGIHPH